MLNGIIEIVQSFLSLALGVVFSIAAVFGIATMPTTPVTQIGINSAKSESSATTTQKIVDINKPQKETEETGIVADNNERKEPDIKNTQPKKGQVDDNIQINESVNKAILQSQNLLKKIQEIRISQVKINVNLNDLAREALVNILCTTRTGGLLNPLTGSGVIINEKGVILTNAHIGQYFLIKDYPTQDSVNCIIRTGSPATPKYKAEILYISPAWVKENANSITLDNPKGTGENDFALLLITGSIRKNISLPEKFSFLMPDVSGVSVKKDAPVLLAGYPAGFLGGITIQKELWITTTISTIKELFTFRNGTIDVFSLNGNIAAQKGSSGGAVVNTLTNKLIGIIVTSTDAKSTKDRELNAITMFHINESVFSDLGIGLNTLLDDNLQLRSETFNKTISPILLQLLVDEIEK